MTADPATVDAAESRPMPAEVGEVRRVYQDEKLCTSCGQLFRRKPKESRRQFSAKRFCSLSCFGRVNIRSADGGWNATSHGRHKTPEYRAWAAMLRRCLNPETRLFHRYGGRGIGVCDRWRSFVNFFDDMGNRPTLGHSLDRYPNNDGDYEPGNCRWATRSQQARNTSRTVYVTRDGVTRCVADWAELTGIPAWTIAYRVRRGMRVDKIFAPVSSLRCAP
jgi:hypothetical protein